MQKMLIDKIVILLIKLLVYQKSQMFMIWQKCGRCSLRLMHRNGINF